MFGFNKKDTTYDYDNWDRMRKAFMVAQEPYSKWLESEEGK